MRTRGPTVHELLLADLANALGLLVLVWAVLAIVLGTTMLPYTTVAGGALAGAGLGVGASLILAAGDVRRRRALLSLALSALGSVGALLVVLGAIAGRACPIGVGAFFLVARVPVGEVRGHATRGGYRPQWFGRRSFEAMVATADVMLDADGREALPPEQVAEHTDHLLHVIDTPLKSQIGLMFIVLEWVLPLIVLLRPLPFTALGERDRRRLVIKLTKATGPIPLVARTFRTIARTMKVLTCAGYYGDPRAKRAVGFVEYEWSPRSRGVDLSPLMRPDPRPKLRVAPVAASSNYDAVIIGSGASGAVMAYQLVSRGLKVAIVERGRHEDPQTFEHDELEMFKRVYKDGGLQVAADRNSAIFQGQTVGGSTVINNAIWLRPPALTEILADWKRRGAEVPQKALEDAYTELEGDLGVSPIDQKVANPGTELFLKGAGTAGAVLENNRTCCVGCGWCNYGCKYNRKASMLVTYIPWALDRGVELFDQVQDARVMVASNGERRATGVTGVRNGKPLRLSADKVIVCAGAIGSSGVLLASGIDGGGTVGKNFHALGGVFVTGDMGDVVVDGYAGIGLTCVADAGAEYVLESYFAPPLAFSIRLGGWMLSHFDRAQRYTHFIDGGVMVGTDPAHGSITMSGGNPTINLTPQGADMDTLRTGIKRMASIYFNAGAERVYPSTFKYIDLLPGTYEQVIDREVRTVEDILFGSAHPQGGNVMCSDARGGVVGHDFQVHGVKNLYVADTSVWPSNIRANCQATAMAMSHYAAGLITGVSTS
jgi:choline dehydrogenase-like flavoprotein